MTQALTAPVRGGEMERLAVDINKAVVNIAGLKAALKTGWGPIGKALPAHMDHDRFLALILGQAAKDSGVFKCTGLSILNACFQAASLGLEINAATGEAYLIPYRDTQSGNTIATLVPGYKGLAKLALQSPEVISVTARLVYRGEAKKFKVLYGTEDRIEHEPDFDCERTPEQVTHAYAVAHTRGGGRMFEVMTRKQLEVIRQKSLKKTSNKGPWATDVEEMYRKTPFRRLAKLLPLTPQLADAIALADAAETGEIKVPKHTSPTADLNAATAAALRPNCIKGCKVEGGKVIHDVDCPNFDDSETNP